MHDRIKITQAFTSSDMDGTNKSLMMKAEIRSATSHREIEFSIPVNVLGRLLWMIDNVERKQS